MGGKLRAFFFEECGYIRTSCKEYDLENLDSKYVHLTNDAIQKNSQHYGKFENGNKVSFPQFQRYIDQEYPDKRVNFHAHVVPQMREVMADSIRAVVGKIDKHKRQHTFELFGYDFMLDEDFKVYLIECNTNPCLSVPCPLLSRLISHVIDSSF